jgi:hypothetical protein
VNNQSVLNGATWIASWFGPMTALILAVLIVAAAIIICAVSLQKLRPLVLALDGANKVLQSVHDAKNDIDAHSALRGAYQNLAGTVRQSGHDGLQRGWTELEESIVDPQADTLCNTVRPDEFFHGLASSTRQLLWWANFALGVGLLFTFLGIIAALGQASSDMSDAAKTGEAVQGLLKVSSAKFLTSLAGVFASLILRGMEASMRHRIESRLTRFINALEHGLQYLPPQRLAQEQLNSLKNIEAAQTRFATELAVAIGEKFHEQVQPMVTMLGDINGSIRNLNEEFGRGLRETVGQGITDAAGEEMKLLAGALTVMTDRLGALPERLNEKAGEAENQIRDAANLFSQAAAGMQTAFAGLMQRIEEMSGALLERQKAAADDIDAQQRDNNARYRDAAKQNADALAQTGEEMRRLMGDVAKAVSAIGPLLTEQAADAAKLQRETSETIARTMAAEAAKAASAVSKEAVEAVTEVVDDLVEQFEAANKRLAERIDAAMARLDVFGVNVARAGDSADSSARRIADAGVAAERLGGQLVSSGQAVTTELGKAAGALGTVAEPIRRSTDAISAALRDTSEAIADQRKAAEALVSSFTATSTAAANAWRSYQERFDEVDDALAEALTSLTRDMQQRAEQLAAFASKIDLNTGRAVDRLATLVEDLAVAQSPPPVGR